MSIKGASLKFVREIRVAFDPFCQQTSSTIAREFIRRVSSPGLLKTNPKFKLSSQVKCDNNPSTIEVTFEDKEKLQLSTTETTFYGLYAEFIRECKRKEV